MSKDKQVNPQPESITNQTDPLAKLEQAPPKRSELIDDLLDALPPWFGEISGIVLLVFGMISLMAIFNIAGDAVLARSWSHALTQLFGYGSILVSLGIIATGIMIFLPRVGVNVRFTLSHLFALEIAFLAFLALLHLLQRDPELRALARAGEGGGFIGWGMCVLPASLFGHNVATMFFIGILTICLGWIVGIRREQITGGLETIAHHLTTYGKRLANIPIPERKKKIVIVPPDPSIMGLETALEKPNIRRAQVLRIRHNPKNLPPSLRALLENPQPESIKDTPTTPAPVMERDEHYDRLSRVLRTSSEAEVNAGEMKVDPKELIGVLLPKQKRTDDQMVQRPDGRVKHYFTAERMREEKKLIKRDKDLPALDLLTDIEPEPPDEIEINHNVVLIENTLLEFDINIDVVDVKSGPTVTQYAVQPFKEVKNSSGEMVKERTRLSKIAALSNDLALSLSVKRLRLETPVPGHSYMGVEVPNKRPSTVTLRSVYESKTFFDHWQKAKTPLVVPLGRDVAGAPVVIDLASMPHLLIAGTTGSGKSVCIAALATALIMNNTPDAVKLVMLDPKMVELSRFNGIPHLLGPVETDLERIIGVLRWCTREMDRRYKLLEENSARNIDTYNSRLGQRRKAEHLPYIAIFVDEVGDLMMSKPEETERTLTRLAQMARAVGMHLIVATQRPSVDVITGLIKANFPSRISFAVASGIDSRVIIDAVGAETLLGRGDMLYVAPDAGAPQRLQGCFLSDEEVRNIVKYWTGWTKEKVDSGNWDMSNVVAPWERGLTRTEFLTETDPMLEDAIKLVVEEQEASASQIQRKMGLGYPRAARIIDLLEELGVIGEQVAGARTRQVLIEKGGDPMKAIIDKRTEDKTRSE